jgi:hypothetical protein
LFGRRERVEVPARLLASIRRDVRAPLAASARSVARRALSDDARWTIALQRQLLSEQGGRAFLRWHAFFADAWLRDRLMGRRRYRQLDEEAVRARRRSETVFVFGSGYSLNDIPGEEWEAMSRHDTFGFNAFYRQNWVRVDFHLLRGGVYGELRWRAHAQEVSARLRQNPHYEDTIFLLQQDYTGSFANQLVGHGLLPTDAQLFRYRTARAPGLPTHSFADGVRHAPGTLSDVVNCAYLLGWKEIVLVGVDLYDSRYFWLEPDQTLAHDATTGNLIPAAVNNIRGQRYDEPHNTARSGVVEQMRDWARMLADEGVSLSVYNPRSLLADVVPVYRLPVHAGG